MASSGPASSRRHRCHIHQSRCHIHQENQPITPLVAAEQLESSAPRVAAFRWLRLKIRAYGAPGRPAGVPTTSTARKHRQASPHVGSRKRRATRSVGGQRVRHTQQPLASRRDFRNGSPQSRFNQRSSMSSPDPQEPGSHAGNPRDARPGLQDAAKLE